MSYQFEVKLDSPHISPASVRASDVAKALEATEELVIALIQSQYPTVDIQTLVIGLTEVQSGSLGCVFHVSSPELLEFSLPQLGAVLQTPTGDSKPQVFVNQKIRQQLLNIQNIGKKYRSNIAFAQVKTGKREVIGYLNPETHLTAQEVIISFQTTLYGRVVRIGGDKPPRAKIHFLEGTHLTCNITAKNKLSVARTLGSHLYQVVGLVGRAERNPHDMSLEAFTIEAVTEYRERPAEETLARLHATMKPYVESVGGSNAYLASLQAFGDDEEGDTA